jgi:Family of unknown function (DUF6441)
MPLRFKVIVVDQSAWLKMARGKQLSVATAAVAALRETAADAVQEGRQNIAASSPRFKLATKWQTGLQYRTKDTTVGGAPSLQANATIFHKYGFAGVFEHGATIHGKPLLWIPTTPGAPTPRASGKKLTSATVRGKPMLFDAEDRDRHRKPLYIGVKSVDIPKMWRITEIVKKHVAKFAQLFIKYFKDN